MEVIFPVSLAFCVGMPRKFRLSVHRKNEFRKRRAERAVTAACSSESVHTLPVSIPLESLLLPAKMYLKAPVLTLTQLQQRLKALPVLPQGSYACVLLTYYS